MTDRSPLEWQRTENADGTTSWTATGPTGTHWEIIDRNSYFAIYVAHWDTADWTADTLEAAMQIASEVDARPPIPKSDQIPEQSPLIKAEGDPYVPFADEPLPEEWGPCFKCASRARPERVKPKKFTPQWWNDPDSFWRCPDCLVERTLTA